MLSTGIVFGGGAGEVVGVWVGSMVGVGEVMGVAVDVGVGALVGVETGPGAMLQLARTRTNTSDKTAKALLALISILLEASSAARPGPPYPACTVHYFRMSPM